MKLGRITKGRVVSNLAEPKFHSDHWMATIFWGIEQRASSCFDTRPHVRTAACALQQFLVTGMESPREPVIAVKAFLHRKWGEDPIEVHQFPFPAACPLSFGELSSKVASAFPTLKQEHLKIHWKGAQLSHYAPLGGKTDGAYTLR